MKFKDFKLKKDNHFIAMQYYGLILNRTFLVLLTDSSVIGIKANGLVSVESSGGLVAQGISKTIAVRGNLNNPYSYLKSKYLEKVHDCDLYDGSLLKKNKSNFIINNTEIKEVYHDPSKKWGMGYYPHDGKVYIKTFDGRKRELIILGSQSGKAISQLILIK